MTTEEINEGIAQVILEVMKQWQAAGKGFALDKLEVRAPKGLWAEVRSLLNKNGILRKKAGEWKEDVQLTQYWGAPGNHKPDIMKRLRGEVDDKQQSHEDSATNITHAIHILQNRLITLEGQMSQMASELRAIKDTTPPNPVHEADIPPYGPQGSSTGNLNANVDKVLYDLVRQEAEKHHGGTNTRALETILWRYYGKPRLSFEPEEKE